ncbi:protein of unknown function [Tenacibaculum mesophilum]|uniref:DUF4856 domain-containing protein n=1 Tax=Tenacibaculum mesophilum TaxID=104268 RepID=A0ABN5T602_9FLAO|nr:DUF4856 domain-containing protein [Tenacibaculum mesophilum]AZJ31880.1 DUF4856 domain-containing protein [Tenacibaculum mesophilum]QFS27135.1 DUF4856 domain-containing protein [Tenacibaculum mesophilum]SHF85523.1 protein of unknown function [Tenacibaculum mesophilum]
MKRVFLSMLAISALVFTSCSDDNDNDVKPPVEAPATYAFNGKDNKSNVSFSGQVARLKMAKELKDALEDNVKTQAQLEEMFKDGTGFEDASLNTSGKKLRGTVASATNSNVDAVETDELRLKMDGWIKDHATEVYANWNTDAAAGTAGKLTTGSRTVHVSAKGVEYNQAVAKTLIGSVIADQMINKYVSQKFIDDNKADHEAGKPYKGDDTKNYTALQHGWDEAYGYLFGLEEDPAKPVNSLDDRKGFLNSYIKSVDNDSKFKGIFDDVYNAFKLGRAAVDANDYELASKQAETIRASVSKVIGVMAAHYLLKGKGAKDANSLHALSEAYGFLQSLRFVEINGQQVEKNQIAGTIAMLEADNGLWSITDDQLDQIASRLGTYFGFTTEDVVSLND